MAPASEIAILPLVINAQVEDSSSDAGKVWKSTLDTVGAQNGYQRAYWGRQVENSDTLELIVDWDSVDAHEAFIKSPVYGPFSKRLETILSGPASISHVHFGPHPPSHAFSNTFSPVTELCHFYFTLDLSDSQRSDFESAFAAFTKAVEKADAFTSISSGWVVENVEHTNLEGKTGKGFVAAIGWQSVDGHMEFRKTTEFKEVIQGLREKSVTIGAHHVSFNGV